MADFILNSHEQLQKVLAREIATSEVERKFKFQYWKNGYVALILISEHGWELTSYALEGAVLPEAIIGFWKNNRWGEPVGRKTAKQIAKKLGYNLDAQIAEIKAQNEIDARNSARHNIDYFCTKAQEVEKDFNEWLQNSYKSNLPGMPKGTWVSIKVKLFDEVGNVVDPDMTKEVR